MSFLGLAAVCPWGRRSRRQILRLDLDEVLRLVIRSIQGLEMMVLMEMSRMAALGVWIARSMGYP